MEYERTTWYDIQGRNAFTISKGLVGLGLLRQCRRTTLETCIQPQTAKTRERNFGWEDLWTYVSREVGDSEDTQKLGGTPKVLEGTTITQWVMEDTLPGRPCRVQRTYVAPIPRTNCEDDYRTARAFI